MIQLFIYIYKFFFLQYIKNISFEFCIFILFILNMQKDENNRYNQHCKIVKKIGEGSYGAVYKIACGQKTYALKIEKIKKTIHNEIEVLKKMNHPSIPKILDQGISNGFEYIIIPIFRVSLHKIQNTSPNFFIPSKINLIGVTILNTLKYIHNKGYVYRDLKPENIMIGYNNNIYLVDFGMCISYMFNKKHIINTKKKKFAGTLRYASINTHNGDLESRRDDLESLVYVLIYLMKGSLPWCQTGIQNHYEVGKLKKDTNIQDYISDIKNGKFISEFLKTVRNLKFDEEPNYCLLENYLNKFSKENEGADQINQNGMEKENISIFKRIKNMFFCCR